MHSQQKTIYLDTHPGQENAIGDILRRYTQHNAPALVNSCAVEGTAVHGHVRHASIVTEPRVLETCLNATHSRARTASRPETPLPHWDLRLLDADDGLRAVVAGHLHVLHGNVIPEKTLGGEDVGAHPGSEARAAVLHAEPVPMLSLDRLDVSREDVVERAAVEADGVDGGFVRVDQAVRLELDL